MMMEDFDVMVSGKKYKVNSSVIFLYLCKYINITEELTLYNYLSVWIKTVSGNSVGIRESEIDGDRTIDSIEPFTRWRTKS